MGVPGTIAYNQEMADIAATQALIALRSGDTLLAQFYSNASIGFTRRLENMKVEQESKRKS